MKIVGVGYKNYASKRNINYSENRNTILNTYDVNLAAAYLCKIIPYTNPENLKAIFKPRYSFPKTPQLYHFFNSVVINAKKPWLTTFETIVPRLPVLLQEHKENSPSYKKFKGNSSLQKIIRAIVSSECKKLISMSDCAKNIQLDFFSQMDITIEPEKLITLLPPQPLLYEVSRSIRNNDFLNFTFVGNDFFRKGGYEMLQAFSEIKLETNFPIKLNIISKIRKEWYGNSSTKKIEEVKSLIKDNSDWINHLQNIPNTDVLKILQITDVGLLPTWSDSFGYSVLEMQASGVPVITTDVRAIPEINNNNCGWIINLEKNIYGELINYKSNQLEISTSIKNQLKSIIHDIILNRQLINQKSEKSLARIKKFHDPITHSIALNKIYNDI